MRKYILLSLFVIIISIFNSCKETFDVNENSFSKPLLVVDGRITDQPNRTFVILSNSANYNSKTNSAETGAQVSIIDNYNNIVYLRETSLGSYAADTPFVGKSGISYKLHIKTKNNDIYESEMKLMPQKLIFDSIYGKFEEKNTTTSFPNNGILGSKSGSVLSLFASLKSTSKNEFYALIEPIYAKAYYEKLYLTSQPPSFYYGTLNDNFSSIPAIRIGNKIDTIQKISNFSLGDLPIFQSFEGSSDNRYGPPIVYAFDLTIRIHPLSIYDYSFYSTYIEQINPQNTFFDPIPSQIVGNINCISDPSKQALGYFNVFPEISILANISAFSSKTSYNIKITTLK
jgi:hypothetical protein